MILTFSNSSLSADIVFPFVVTRRLVTIAIIAAILLQPMGDFVAQRGCVWAADVSGARGACANQAADRCSGCGRCRLKQGNAHCDCCSSKRQQGASEMASADNKRSCCGKSSSAPATPSQQPENSSPKLKFFVGYYATVASACLTQSAGPVDVAICRCGCGQSPSSPGLPASPERSHNAWPTDLNLLGSWLTLPQQLRRSTRQNSADLAAPPLHFAQQHLSVWLI